MNAAWEPTDELVDLVETLCSGDIMSEQFARLTDLILSDSSARQYYVRYLHMHASLPRILQTSGTLDGEREEGEEGRTQCEVSGQQPFGVGDSSPLFDSSPQFSLFPPGILDSEWRGTTTLPPSLPQRSFVGAWQTSAGIFHVGGPVFSYMVASVILGVMLLSAWAYKITHYNQRQMAEGPTQAASSDTRPQYVFVGRITGMKDCRWSDPKTEAYLGSSVPLDRRYALSSGLMEISYKSGAKVILEGPCTYKVESFAGGYLAVGKLTVRIGERGERRGERERTKDEGRRMKFAASAKPQAANPKSPNLQISKSPNHYPLSTIHYPLFAVRTPTAIVTDLGTEFGVEVNEDGDTTSHVFRGSVKVQAVGDGERQDVVLRENESARVEKGKGAGDMRLITGGKVGAPPKFVRRMVEPPKYLDLLDIVAGGNGLGNRRQRGIDPATGREDPVFVPQCRYGDRNYWPVGWHKLIDGIFVPDGRAGPVQLDSAGHVFAGFPPTNGRAWGSIWAREAEFSPRGGEDYGERWIYAIGRGEKYMPDERGMLCMHSNGGITFDLEAVRQVHPTATPARFRAVVGLADLHLKGWPDKVAVDVWVFVDGRLKLKKIGLRLRDGPVPIDVELSDSDRHLTLVLTESDDNYFGDCVVFGDPVLVMEPVAR